jgi:polyhydroxybutyrate depolymerase
MRRPSTACALALVLAGCAASVPGEASPRARAAPEDAAPSAGCARPRDDVPPRWSVDVADERRTFMVHVPLHAPRPAPVVLSFHGYRNFPLFQKVLSELTEKADREGFVLVHPRGSGRPLGFNGLGCCGSAHEEGVDDVAFTDAMLDALEKTLCIDRRRVYVTGFSNGGFMAQRLACERSGRFAAAASVAGLLDTRECKPQRPISMLEIHGTADEFVSYEGAPGRFVSARQAFEFWGSVNTCRDAVQPGYASGDTRCERRAQCAGGAEVTLCTIRDGGHTWPGGMDNLLVEKIAGKVTHQLSASDAIWAFFERHVLPFPE